MMRISQSDLIAQLDRLAHEGGLIAPRLVDGVLLYRPVGEVGEIIWDFVRPVLSIKEFFFAPTEHLMRIEKFGNEVRITETLPQEKQIIFGVRPCDARGLLALDALFLQNEPADPYYARRRENTTLIGTACEVLGPTCFCTRMGGALDDPQGMDVMLTPHEETYAVQAVTRKGQALLNSWGIQAPIEPALPREALANIPPQEVWPDQFEDAFWQQFSERCLSCRTCAYVCPTCRCFDVRDEVVPSADGSQVFERIRTWDACAGEPYRRVAGGHNPRPEKGMRLRNRFYCKFFYYPQQVGPLACTGCGRCIDSCPVNVDITEVLDHMALRGA
jgi:sulfhydrogenase subunit beta (sulfur reductase)